MKRTEGHIRAIEKLAQDMQQHRKEGYIGRPADWALVDYEERLYWRQLAELAYGQAGHHFAQALQASAKALQEGVPA